MILAKDLRIGNLFVGIAGIQTVMSIEDNTERGKYNMGQYDGYSHLILCKENRNQYKPCEIDGVSLTDHWIRKLGFDLEVFNDGDTPMYHKPGVDFYIDGLTYQPIDCGFEIAKYTLLYVHQLQNLYFYLTQEELTLKP